VGVGIFVPGCLVARQSLFYWIVVDVQAQQSSVVDLRQSCTTPYLTALQMPLEPVAFVPAILADLKLAVRQKGLTLLSFVHWVYSSPSFRLFNCKVMTRSFNPVHVFRDSLARHNTNKIFIYDDFECTESDADSIVCSLSTVLWSERESDLWWRAVATTVLRFASDNNCVEIHIRSIGHTTQPVQESLTVLFK